MKTSTLFAASAACLVSTGVCVAAFNLPQISMPKHESASEVQANQMPNVFKSYALAPESVMSATEANSDLPEGVVATTVLYEDFALWTDGSDTEPGKFVDGSLQDLMTDPEGWDFHLTRQAGGAIYFDFTTDDKGEADPGYVLSKSADFKSEGTDLYRFTCRAKNANPDNQDQQLQAFFLDETADLMVNASAVPMKYNEWVECSWTGYANTDSLRVMLMGWKGKVYVDDFKLEKLTYPYSRPSFKTISMEDIGKINITWNKSAGATAYAIEARDRKTNKLVESIETGDVDQAYMSFIPEADVKYNFYIIAKGEKGVSPQGGTSADALTPKKLDRVLCGEATNVNNEGFTINWDKVTNGLNYLVSVTQTTTATEDIKDFVLLNEQGFTGVPATCNANNPLMIIPLLGKGGLDCTLTRTGFTVNNSGMFMNMMGMGGIIFTDAMKADGMITHLESPMADFSTGDSTVTISSTLAMSAVDDMLLNIGFIDSKGKKYGEKTAELNIKGGSFSVTLEGGRPNSKIYIEDGETTAAGGDMAILFDLKITKNINAGETFTWPMERVITAHDVTSLDVKAPVDSKHSYTYFVQAYFGFNVAGRASIPGTIEAVASISPATQNAASVVVEGSAIAVSNPDGAQVNVYAIDGRIAAAGTTAAAQTFELATGIYIVKVGNETFKIAK